MGPQRSHGLADFAQEEKVIVDSDKCQDQHGPFRLHRLVSTEYREKCCALGLFNSNLRLKVTFMGIWVLDLEKVEKGMCGVGIIPAEGLETKLPMHEYDCISLFEEVFGGRCTSSSYKGAVSMLWSVWMG